MPLVFPTHRAKRYAMDGPPEGVGGFEQRPPERRFQPPEDVLMERCGITARESFCREFEIDV